jgi:hypothetical protein
MQRNPYWPLKGPSFFSVTKIPSSNGFVHRHKRSVGFGLKFRGTDGKPTSESRQLESTSWSRTRFQSLLKTIEIY